MSTHTASTTSYADVNTALGLCSDGDTLAIPAGTSNWTTQLVISKAIILQGNGIGSTIITTGVVDGTSLIQFNLVASKPSRMTGIEFQVGTVAVNSAGAIHIEGNNSDGSTMRVDHCKFTNLGGQAFIIYSAIGVCDHCTILGKSTGIPAWVGYVKGNNWNGSANGDGEWAEADQFGTDRFWFFEDNTISSSYNNHLGAIDGQAGARFVVRYNTITNGDIEGHGTEASRERSVRAIEIYNNTFVGEGTQSTLTYFRGGVGLIHDNTATGYTSSANFALVNNRSQDALAEPFGGSDGRNPWDVNDAGNPFVTGTASSGGSLSMTDSGKTWTTNQWAGYTVRRTSGKSVTLARSGGTVTATCTAHGYVTGDIVSIYGANEQPYNQICDRSASGVQIGVTVTDANHFTYDIGFTPASPATGTILTHKGLYFSDIISNTSTALTLRDSIYGGAYTMVWAAGETYEINLVTHSMDMIGRRTGSLLSGDTPSIPAGWNDQVTSAWYEWNNTREAGANVNFSPVQGIIKSGTHYNNDTAKPGYTPYTYPHPLVSGGPVYGIVFSH